VIAALFRTSDAAPFVMLVAESKTLRGDHKRRYLNRSIIARKTNPQIGG